MLFGCFIIFRFGILLLHFRILTWENYNVVRWLLLVVSLPSNYTKNFVHNMQLMLLLSVLVIISRSVNVIL